MSVDIEKYGEQYYKDYLNEDFEFKMVYYRKKHVIELMTKYHARKILEIGCGMDPIFLAYPQYEQMTIVEPATIMYESAVTHAKDKKISRSFMTLLKTALKMESANFLMRNLTLYFALVCSMKLQTLRNCLNV